MAVTIQAKFKRDAAHFDGLGAHSDDIVKNPMTPVVVVAVMECTHIDENILDGTKTPKMKLTSVEVCGDKDAIAVTSMIQRLYGQRTGRSDYQPSLFDPPEDGDEPWPGDVEHPDTPALQATDDDSQPASQAEAPRRRRKAKEEGEADAEQ